MRYKLYRERNLPDRPNQPGGLSVSVMVEWPGGTHSHEEILVGAEPESDQELHQFIAAELRSRLRDRPKRRMAMPSRKERSKEWAETQADEVDIGDA